MQFIHDDINNDIDSFTTMRAFDPNFLTNSFTNSFIRGKFSPNEKFTFRKTTLNMTWSLITFAYTNGVPRI